MSKIQGNQWAVLAVVSLAYFMAQLDILALTVAIPDIAEDLQASLDDIVWALGVYILTLALSLITAGRLGDLYGRRRVFLLGVALFTGASLVGGLAQGPGQLIAARAVQGLGAALLTPQTMALLVEVFPPDRRGMALGFRGAVGGVAAILGPVVGGLLVANLGWSWVLFVNVPIGLALIVLAWIIVPEFRHGQRPRLDLLGVLLATASLFCLAFALNQGEKYHWNGRIWALLIVGAVMFALFLMQERRRQSSDPLLPFELFRERNFSLMNAFSVTISITVIGLVLVLSVFFQSVLGFSALKAGLVLLPASLFSMILDPVAGKLSDRIGGKILLIVGVGFTVAGVFWAALGMKEGVDWPFFVLPMCVIGIGNAFLFTPLAAVALRSVRPQMAGASAGVLVTTLQLGSMVGTATVGTLLQRQAGIVLSAAETQAAMLALAVVALLSACFCLATRSAPAKTNDGESEYAGVAATQ